MTAERTRHAATCEPTSTEAPRDQLTDALGVAGLGLAMGAFTAARTAMTGIAELVLTGAFAAVVMSVAIALDRRSRTAPRQVGRWWRIGSGTSLVVALVAVLPYLNLQAQTQVPSGSVRLGAAIVVALPSVVAAVLIAEERQ